MLPTGPALRAQPFEARRKSGSTVSHNTAMAPRYTQLPAAHDAVVLPRAGRSPRGDEELRGYLRRWMGTAIRAQPRFVIPHRVLDGALFEDTGQ